MSTLSFNHSYITLPELLSYLDPDLQFRTPQLQIYAIYPFLHSSTIMSIMETATSIKWFPVIIKGLAVLFAAFFIRLSVSWFEHHQRNRRRARITGPIEVRVIHVD
ncbi:hypothetical protein ASPWEDRAFT_43070 [Aspergillus wentii DTO 134E9]|uniref:Uncharacterized protein n=1 Tax=Aspergillus wentii DTO 134E9 TaxID=1073089 RepID=A0A1L9RDM9_ASPWE|nr:uncharacterized protein ASPWEDRAFT_43070 [Aspergillus wentii DTO 134E9]KAI9933296.1 hypothetical protein MW887_007769 [Aspergillus wentii]OJJ33025.1 hypothetical protein ASPWEDRAFT_43070 [Aspergillus wentii DTO 134E9]